MFTGIIEEVGEISRIVQKKNAAELWIRGPLVTRDANPGDSISVNGICLTVTSLNGNVFSADVMPETLRRTALFVLGAGSRVNLERAMPANGRFGGHIVSGHIDGTGTILSLLREENAVWVTVRTSPEILGRICEKGSIAIDGISLTVASLEQDSFSVSVIPHTGQQTTLLEKKVGDPVNLENDMIGKYVERFLSQREPAEKKEPLNLGFLAEHGFL